MVVSIEDVLGKVKRPVRSVSVCLDGELRARHDELVAQLEQAREPAGRKMGQSSAVRELAEQIQAVEQAMREAQIQFKFRGVSRYELEAIKARFPKAEGRGWDVMAGAPALVAACSFEPKMTEAQARQLLGELDEGTGEKLLGAAWTATTGSSDIPFFARASELIASTDSK